VHNSSEGLTVGIRIIYFMSAAKVVMVDGSKQIPTTTFAWLKKQLNIS